MKNIVINDLVNYDGLKIFQNKDYFNFSLESILLPNFVPYKKNIKNILDLGCGNAPISVILSKRFVNSNIIGVEIQKEIYDLAKKTLKINNLENKIKLINDDMKNISEYFTDNYFDLIISNPPYFKINEESKINENYVKSLARHEIKINLEEIIIISKKMLNNKGMLALVHRTERITDVLFLMRKHNIEPKLLKFIYPKKDSESNLFMVIGHKCGKVGLKVNKPVVVHNENGTYTEEVLKNFKMED